MNNKRNITSVKVTEHEKLSVQNKLIIIDFKYRLNIYSTSFAHKCKSDFCKFNILGTCSKKKLLTHELNIIDLTFNFYTYISYNNKISSNKNEISLFYSKKTSYYYLRKIYIFLIKAIEIIKKKLRITYIEY